MSSLHLRARHAGTVSSLLIGLVLCCVGPTGPAHAMPVAHHIDTRPATHARASARDARVLALLNQARRHPRSCGGVRYHAVRPLRLNHKLTLTSQAFARLMGVLDFFDHLTPGGIDPGHRITAAGYHWHAFGENIAAGYATPRSVVAGWLHSPDHCANIMSPFRDVGIGYADVASSTYGSYWVTDFGTH